MTLNHQEGTRWLRFESIKSSAPSAAYMHRWIGSLLVQIMACRLFGAKPLSKPMLDCYQFDKLQWNFNQCTKQIINENTSENIVCKMAVILSRPQCINISHTSSHWLDNIQNCQGDTALYPGASSFGTFAYGLTTYKEITYNTYVRPKPLMISLNVGWYLPMRQIMKIDIIIFWLKLNNVIKYYAIAYP